jgi:membrane fusion protein (multidrug efflux system)
MLIRKSWIIPAMGCLIIGSMPMLSACTSAGHLHKVDVSKTVEQQEQTLATTRVETKLLARQTELPGEVLAFQDVAVYSRAAGFVDSIAVDRGFKVRKGQVLIQISAPELEAKVAEAKAKVEKARSSMMQAKSKLSGTQANVREGQARESAELATHERLKKAALMPGVISENELDVSQKRVDGEREHIESLNQAVLAANAEVLAAECELTAAKEGLEAIKAERSFLTIRAPFDGVITSRNVHPGSLVSPSESGPPMVRLQQLNPLRLVVAVPEIDIAGVSPGDKISFDVPAYPGCIFQGTVARISNALDQRTRTMPVELDVTNSEDKLRPGMYPKVLWSVKRPYMTNFVRTSAVGRSLMNTFVIAIRNGKTQTLPVRTGQTMGDSIEVFGDIKPGEIVALKASEDVKTGTSIKMSLTTSL